MMYDFVCRCGLEFSKEFEAFSCPDTVPCRCGKLAKAKSIDASNIHFKGDYFVGKLAPRHE